MWLPVAFGGAAFAWVLAATARWGPGVSNDSVTYLSVARSLAAGGGLVRFDGASVEAWPPLYPWLLSLIVRTGLEPSDAARAVGAVSAAVAMAALVALLSRAVRSPGWAVWGGLLAFASPVLWRTFASAWSESLFVAFVMTACWLVGRIREWELRDVLLLGVVASATCLTRWIGVALVGALALWLLGAPGAPGERWKRTAVFAGTAALGPALWGTRNLIVAGGAPFGARGVGYAGLGRNFGEYLENLGATLSFAGIGVLGPPLAATVLLGACLLALRAWARDREIVAPVPVAALFLLLYSVVLVGIASWTPVALLSRVRFGAPVWLPFVILLVIGASHVARASRRARPGVLAAAALVAALGLANSAVALSGFRSSGVHGLGRAHWTTSGLLDALRRDYSGAGVVSNRPHAVYLHTAIPAVYSPRRHRYRSDVANQSELSALRNRVARDGSVSLAWFGKYLGGYGFYLPRELLAEGFCVRAVGRYNDGVLFRVSSESPCPLG
ncbi:MAG: glycosyltransferase family 39 protein [Myxococcota bacterium]|nr:hypothetical protein [bacterium]MDP6074984.1 glycosyltransferase family 39 protein [Myxococcota bacterium]MDP6243938.1 glycosyltransferase family 39 protein [Myxococcota bacterium]MDP7076257.1 glycosyltransferase family 39 protein [Myxococcota bacterium]MDP7298096.1 glycosyltransferase family 39 protein [Myxococcota bacterium]